MRDFIKLCMININNYKVNVNGIVVSHANQPGDIIPISFWFEKIKNNFDNNALNKIHSNAKNIVNVILSEFQSIRELSYSRSKDIDRIYHNIPRPENRIGFEENWFEGIAILTKVLETKDTDRLSPLLRILVNPVADLIYKKLRTDDHEYILSSLAKAHKSPREDWD